MPLLTKGRVEGDKVVHSLTWNRTGFTMAAYQLMPAYRTQLWLEFLQW